MGDRVFYVVFVWINSLQDCIFGMASCVIETLALEIKVNASNQNPIFFHSTLVILHWIFYIGHWTLDIGYWTLDILNFFIL